MKKPPTSFRTAYDILQQHAHTLREQDEPAIDQLLDIVQESVAAYQVCQQQIAAVEQALAQALTDMDAAVNEGAGAAAATPTEPIPAKKAKAKAVKPPPVPVPPPAASTGSFDDFADDDIPF